MVACKYFHFPFPSFRLLSYRKCFVIKSLISRDCHVARSTFQIVYYIRIQGTRFTHPPYRYQWSIRIRIITQRRRVISNVYTCMNEAVRTKCKWLQISIVEVPELSTGRMDPRVGSGRVTILPDFGGSGRVSTLDFLVFHWLFLGT